MPATLDRTLVHEVAGWIESRLEDPFSLEGISELEADVLGTITAKGVIGNGGLVYWYEGKGRDETVRVAASFDRLGLTAVGDAMRDSLSAFPQGTPPQDLGARQEFVSLHRSELEARFEALDEVIWRAEYDLAAARYLFRRRHDLLALEPGFGPLLQQFEAADRARTDRLLAAIASLPDAARARCESAICTADLAGALGVAVAEGADQSAAFWSGLAEVARALGLEARSEECAWQRRIASRGALVVATEFVPATELTEGDGRVHRSGDKLRWNVGTRPAALFGARRAELFIAGRGWVSPGGECEVFLIPGDDATALGTTVVLHSGGEVIGRGRVAAHRTRRSR